MEVWERLGSCSGSAGATAEAMWTCGGCYGRMEDALEGVMEVWLLL